MSSHDYLPHAAIAFYGAMVAITTWLSYRRIMKKYPPAKAGRDTSYNSPEFKRR